MNTARRGTKRGCSNESRTCSTTSSPRPSGSIASGYSNPKRIAIEGGSNGGLLDRGGDGAAPGSLWRRCLPRSGRRHAPLSSLHGRPILDFGIRFGRRSGAVSFLYRYSPLHNVVDGTAYPPILITTADTDDRVAPGMAKKFAARLQAAGHAAPVLIRVETKAGHGAGKPLSKTIEEDADIFAFVFCQMLGHRIARFSAEFSPILPWRTPAPDRRSPSSCRRGTWR